MSCAVAGPATEVPTSRQTSAAQTSDRIFGIKFLRKSYDRAPLAWRSRGRLPRAMICTHPPEDVAASPITRMNFGCDIFVDAGMRLASETNTAMPEAARAAFSAAVSFSGGLVGWVERLRNPSPRG